MRLSPALVLLLTILSSTSALPTSTSTTTTTPPSTHLASHHQQPAPPHPRAKAPHLLQHPPPNHNWLFLPAMVAGVHVAATSSYRIIVLTLSQRCNEREIRTRPFTGYRTQADWLNSIVNECLDRYDVLHLAAPRPATPSTHPQLDHAVVPEDLHSGEGGGEGEGEGGVSKFVEPTAAALRKAFRPWPLAARRAWVRAARAASPAHDLEASLASSLAAAADRY